MKCVFPLLWFPALLSGLAVPHDEKLEDMPRIEVQPLVGRLHHVQGIDIEGDHIWVTSVNADSRKGYLHLFDRKSGRVIAGTEKCELSG
jgi:hypothetical protein